MKTKPETDEQKYIFLVDNQDLAFSLIGAGFLTVALLPAEDGYHSLESFAAYMEEIAYAGTYQMDYCYVTACYGKKYNDFLEQMLHKNFLTVRQGWYLFKEKEYLQKLEHMQEIKSLLGDYIKRFERRPDDTPDLNRFHRFNEQGKRIGVFDMEIVDHLIQTVPFFMLGSTPYIYEQGCYHEDHNGIRLKSQIQRLIFRDYIKATTIQGIYNLLISQPQVQKRFSDLNNQPSYWVNFQNGYFDVMEWKMIEHDTKYLMINQIPFSFYPEQAESALEGGAHICKYLDFSISDKTDQQTFWQYLGYCMTTDTRFQKFLMIKGKGGTGKSIAISFIQHIVGSGNYSSMSLQNLNQRFYPTGLFGKLLNGCADIPSTAMERVDIIKKAVGEDTLLYEKKGQDPTQFNSYAKLLFSANEMPLNLDDKTNAYYRRLLVLDINRTIPEEEKDLQLKEKMKRSDVYKMYEEYCEDNGRTPHGKSRFWEYMADKGFVIKRYSDGAYYFKDTTVQESDFEAIDDTIANPFEQMDLSLA